MVDPRGKCGRRRTSQGKMPFEEVGVGGGGRVIIWRGGGGQFRGFTHCVNRISIFLWGCAKHIFKRDEQIRFIVGDLELNLGDAMAKKRWQDF